MAWGWGHGRGGLPNQNLMQACLSLGVGVRLLFTIKDWLCVSIYWWLLVLYF